MIPNFRLIARAVLIGAVLFSSLAAAADAGRVISAAGGVSLIRGGAKLGLENGTVLQAGDVLLTGSDGKVQWQSADEGWMVLSADSRFTIHDYAWSGGAGKSEYELESGRFGTISGLIQSPAYRVTTPLADIAIKGTQYKSVLCKASCDGFADGLYVAVVEGEVTVSNSEGKLEGNAGTFIFVSGKNKAPIFVKKAPKVLASLSFELDFAVDHGGLDRVIEGPIGEGAPNPLERVIERVLSPS